ncbi:MAG: hypothetical protein ACK5KN_04945 [Dysgonomonas sp.]|jgi:hypothetical protein|uniref:hypothetical protein n=1 Tax=unclassified Dysgonomonas TaxID=2630389 RepID=UPI0025B8CC37|nr:MULTISPECIES: hypothetical protein [unclassified Dysgonomonas]MDR1715031.1 hypothetical protein [Prevotella sp.]MDR2001544.1 hypothetical protein [Prevotella sp.]HMM03117.1 hypothetical protein [Dysgonomonas sp.]
MNAIFNINRFWELEKRNFFLSRMQYLYIAGGLTGLYFLSMLLNVLTSDNNLIWLIYLIVGTIIIAGPCFFEKSRGKHSSIFDFTLPSSTFEKFISVWIKYVIVLPVMVFILLSLLNIITGIIPVEGVQSHAKEMVLTENLYASKTLFSMLFFQSVFMCGYYYFKRYAFAKTSVVLLILFIVAVFGAILMVHLSMEHGNMTFNLNSDQQQAFRIGYEAGHSVGLIAFTSDSIVRGCSIIIDVVVPTGMWIVSFFKLRETEI